VPGYSLRDSAEARSINHVEQGEGLAPFEIEVGDIQLLVKGFEAGVEELILLVLPVGAGGVAEEEAAAEGTDLVDGAEFVDLEGAAFAVGWEGGRMGGGEVAKVVEEGGEFEGGDVEAVAEFFEVAAAAAEDAEGTALVDLFLKVLINLSDGGAYVGALRGGKDGFAGRLKLGVS
jgi:hypothetical protein